MDMAVVVLNVKVDDAVKEKLRHYAEENSLTLGAAVEKLLLLAFNAEEAEVCEEDIDSQNTQEEALPLTSKEIKLLRKMLKKKK